MLKLEEKAPRIFQHFMDGDVVLAISKQKFAQLPVDKTLEQTLVVNRYCKTCGSIDGFSNKAESVQQWILTARYRVDMLSQLRVLLKNNYSSHTVKDLGQNTLTCMGTLKYHER